MNLLIPLELFTGSELAHIPKDEVIVYLVMRADCLVTDSILAKAAKESNYVVSLLEVHTIAQNIGSGETTVFRLIEDLIRRGWVKKIDLSSNKRCYCLGGIENNQIKWFLDEILQVKKENLVVKRASLTDQILEKAKLDRDEKMRRGTVVLDTRRKDQTPKDLILYFSGKYSSKYREKLPVSWEKDIVLMKRIIDHAGNSYDEVRKTIDYVFDEWDNLISKTFLKGRPTVAMLSANAIWVHIRSCMVEGIKTGKSDAYKTSDRYKPDSFKDEKTVGWD